MKAVDTNILARFILNDDPVQAPVAAAMLMRPIWISTTVWLELGWLLGTRARLDRTMMADALDLLLRLETVHTSDRQGMAWAVARYRTGADWADMVHLVAARGNAGTFATFDRAIAGVAGEDTPVAIETRG